jgi:hypothetical protein
MGGSKNYLENEDTLSESKKKINAVVLATERVIAEGVARATSFKDAEKFKRFLLDALNSHPEFSKAAHALHEHAQAVFQSEQSQVPRQIVPSGRVQAPRRDWPQGRRTKPKGR